MSPEHEPVTLGELLVALERSENLRSLARECGMAPGDLRRSLRRWRRDLGHESGPTVVEAGTAPQAKNKPQIPSELEGLTAAADLDSVGPDVAAEMTVWTDGASRGNPGPAAIGVVFGAADGTLLAAHAETIGRTTNNVAEYKAALRALEYAVAWKVKTLRLYLDSELVAKQLTGHYRVKSQVLMPFFRQIVSLSAKLGSFEVRHVRREKNKLADALANLALDGHGAPFGA